MTVREAKRFGLIWVAKAGTLFLLLAQPVAANPLLLSMYCGFLPSAPGMLLGLERAALPRPLPFIKQDINGKCGPTSLAIALAYFGRIEISNPLDPIQLQLCNLTTLAVANVAKARAGLHPGTPLDPASASIVLNSSDNLVATAQLYGLSSRAEIADLGQIARYIGQQGEVILIHWWMGPGPMDYHWSAIQEINSAVIELRDPWITSPSQNTKPLLEFATRSPLGALGWFSIVRISDRHI